MLDEDEYEDDFEDEDEDEDDDDLEYNDYGHVPHGQMCEVCGKRRATIARDSDYYCDDCV